MAMTEHGAGSRSMDSGPEPVTLERAETEPARRGLSRHRLGATVAVVAFVALVAATVGVAMSSRTHGPAKVDDRRHHTNDPHLKLDRGPARVQVLSALSATTAAHSFDVSYHLSEVRPEPATTSTFECGGMYKGGPYPGPSGTLTPYGPPPVSAVCSSGPQPVTTVVGHGTINVGPKAMVVSASISGGLNVSVRLDDEKVWESGGADYGAAPNGSSNAASGQPLSGFASLTEGTIGAREGAIGMLGMASPSGYLDLESQSVTGAAQDGTGTVDGVSVTYYRVAVDPSKLVDAPGMTADEIATVDAAVGVLQQQGYTGTEARVALDATGYIRQVTSVASFADGGTVTLASTFSNFGCAGTVTMPGEPIAPPPPPNCTSPVPSTTTTTAPAVPTTDSPVSTMAAASSTSTVSDVSTTEPTSTSDPTSSLPVQTSP
jgi:hypothetical protein